MINRELKNLFNDAKKECQPDMDWANDTRGLLLSQVRNEMPKQNIPFLMKFADHLVPANLAFKPVAVFCLIAGLLLVSSFGSVGAAQNTLPGDTLYPVKITAENIKYNLTLSQEGKAKVAMDMVEKRASELKVIVADQENGEREYKIVQASKKIKDSLNKVKDKVQIISEKPDADLVGVVEEIDKKLAMVGEEINEAVTMAEEVLEEIEDGEDLEDKVADELAQVAEEVEEASSVIMAALEDTENTKTLKHLNTKTLKQNSVEGITTLTSSEQETEEVEEVEIQETEIYKAPIKDILGIEEEEVEIEEFKVNIGN